jgi:glycosyltransferase involved in cell wall biosynthesis
VKTLLYFCQYFPFGQREPLAQTEVFQLAPHFEKILIIPFFREEGERPIPENAEVHWFEKSTRSWNAPKTCNTHQVSQNILKRIPEIGPLDQWNLEFVRKWRAARIHAERLMFDLDISSETILYSPWMNPWGATLSIVKEYLKELKVYPSVFFRANGADLYRERMTAVQRKFQAVTLELATRVFTVSNHGSEHLKHHYPRYSWKIETSYHGNIPLQLFYSPGNEKRWLSVSTLQPVKRLERILELLSKVTEPTVWTHLGGEGKALAALKKRCEALPPHITVDFRGRMRQGEILDVLQNEHFDLFLNVSDSEGLPLSAVEAAQAGIPLLLSDVGGSKEIPHAQVLPVSPFLPEVWLSKIHDLQNQPLQDRQLIQSGAQLRFGWKNYSEFAQKMLFDVQGTVVIMDDNLPGYSIAKALIDAGVAPSKITVIRKRIGRMKQLSIADFDASIAPKPWILFPLNEGHWEEAKKWKEREPDSIRLTFDPITRNDSLQKHLQREKVQKAGIPTVPFSLVQDFVWGTLPLPLVVKPSNKMEEGRKAERLILIHSLKDWEEQRHQFQPTDLVESWKKGAKVAAVVGFRGESEVEQFSAFRRRCYPDDYTVFSTVEVLENETLLQLSSQILEQIPVKGLFEIEFLETENGFEFLELNNRATTWIEAWRWTGKNVVFQTLLWSIGKPTNITAEKMGSGWLVHRKHEWLNLKHKPDQVRWLVSLYLKGKKAMWI